MTIEPRHIPAATGLRGLALAAVLIGAGGVAVAQAPFTALGSFDGGFRASGPDRGPIVAGGEAEVSARGLQPGQTVTLRQSGTVLNGGEAFTADEAGELQLTLPIPDDAVPGLHPVVAELGAPPYALTFDLKVSPELGDIGADLYTTEAHALVPGLYQVAVSDALGAVYVTSAVGRPPVQESQLVKLDPDTLEIVASATPEAAPAREDGREAGVFAVYGIGVAEAAGQVWVTNTRQDTVAVYDAGDLSLIKQFAPGIVGHPRDAVAHDGKVYVSATFEPVVHVFDTETLEELAPIELTSARRREEFTAASLSLDAQNGVLAVSSLRSEEIALIDLASGRQTGGFPVEGSVGTIGVAVDPARGLVYTTAQGNDIVSILDVQSGEKLAGVPVGAGPLNVAVEPVSGNAYVAVRGSDTVVVLSPEGQIVANLRTGSFPNHLAADGKGGMLVVNKRRGEDDSSGDHITRIVPAE